MAVHSRLPRKPPRAKRPAARNWRAPLFDEIRVLEAEHRNFRRLLGLFERELGLLGHGEVPDYDLMRDIMQYLVQYTDRFHHPREDLIIERIVKRDAAAGTLVRSVLREHEELPAKATELLAMLDDIVAGGVVARETFGSIGRAYLDQMRKHMALEESTLFPLVRRLTAADWSAIAAEAAHREDPLFGPNVAPGYRTLFQRLSEGEAG